MSDQLGDLIDRLERTAARLREGELAPEEAAGLVVEGARRAGAAATELDRRVRASTEAGGRGPLTPGQGELLG
jgi:hypothetical protein